VKFSTGCNAFVKKTLAEVKTILGLGSAAYETSAVASTPNTLVKRDGNGYVEAGIFKQPYSYLNTNIGTILTQVDPATDGYLRPASVLQVKQEMAKQNDIQTLTSSCTLSASNAGNLIFCNNSAAIVITIPSGVFSVGTEIAFYRNTAYDVSISPASGVTIYSKDSAKRIASQSTTCALKQTSTNVWILAGALKV
jgi:hypothetical protein